MILEFIVFADLELEQASQSSDSQTLPAIVGGICLSLAMVFFGLWFTSRMKMKKASTKATKDESQEKNIPRG